MYQRKLTPELPSNRDLLNKIENDLSILRGEVGELVSIVRDIKSLLREAKRKELSKIAPWDFANH